MLGVFRGDDFHMGIKHKLVGGGGIIILFLSCTLT